MFYWFSHFPFSHSISVCVWLLRWFALVRPVRQMFITTLCCLAYGRRLAVAAEHGSCITADGCGVSAGG